jgi:SAM-dependent methyltransferase
MERLVWTQREVVDVDGPRAMLRTYLEQRDVRELCAGVCVGARLASACDVGCGFGRLTPVLTEFAERVVGFERETGLLSVAQSLQPSIDFRPVESLQCLPADRASFNLGLVFTVLQHVPAPDVSGVIDELRRIIRPDGYLLLCEETDATLEAGDRRSAHLGYTCGRLVTTYGAWLAPWTLVETRRRSIEPGYPRPDVGTYMLFAGPDASRPAGFSAPRDEEGDEPAGETREADVAGLLQRRPDPSRG